MAKDTPTKNTQDPSIESVLGEVGLTPEEIQLFMAQQASGGFDQFDPFGADFSTGKMFGGYKTSEKAPSAFPIYTPSPRKQKLRGTFAVPGGGERSFSFDLDGLESGMHARLLVKVQGGANQRGEGEWHDMDWYKQNKGHVQVTQIGVQISNDPSFRNPQGQSIAKFYVDPKQGGKITGKGTWQTGTEDNVIHAGELEPVRDSDKATTHINLPVPKGKPGYVAPTSQERIPRGNEQRIRAARARDMVTETKNEVNIQDELKSIYKLPPDEIKDIKTKLWMAGYFGNTGIDEMDLENIDAQTFNALAEVMVQASRYYAAGVDVTWRDLLARMAQDGPNADGKNPNPVHVELTDPAALEETMRTLAPDIIGRRLSPEDVRAFIDGVHSEETTQQTAAAAETDTTTFGVSPEARARQFLRQRYPDEATASEWADRAQEWQDLLANAPTPQPQVQEI